MSSRFNGPHEAHGTTNLPRQFADSWRLATWGNLGAVRNLQLSFFEWDAAIDSSIETALFAQLEAEYTTVPGGVILQKWLSYKAGTLRPQFTQGRDGDGVRIRLARRPLENDASIGPKIFYAMMFRWPQNSLCQDDRKMQGQTMATLLSTRCDGAVSSRLAVPTLPNITGLRVRPSKTIMKLAPIIVSRVFEKLWVHTRNG